jgi:hypothetical protein
VVIHCPGKTVNLGKSSKALRLNIACYPSTSFEGFVVSPHKSKESQCHEKRSNTKNAWTNEDKLMKLKKKPNRTTRFQFRQGFNLVQFSYKKLDYIEVAINSIVLGGSASILLY